MTVTQSDAPKGERQGTILERAMAHAFSLQARHLPLTRFDAIYRRVRPYSLLSYQRLRTMHRLALAVDQQSIPGDIVELGTYRGGSLAMLAAAAPRRHVWGFDTFAGLPAPTSNDPDYQVAVLDTGTLVARKEDVAALLRRAGAGRRSTLVEGLFADTLPGAGIERIALLHMDGDWYESTRDGLENLYDKVSPGGYIVLDDYGYWLGCRKAVTEFLQERGLAHRVKLIRSDYTGYYFRKPLEERATS